MSWHWTFASGAGFGAALAWSIVSGAVEFDRAAALREGAGKQESAPAARPTASPPAERDTIEAGPSDEVPTFDIVTVTPEGDLLVAGRGRRGEKLRVMANGEEIGTVRTGGTGDFVFTTEDRVVPGEYVVRLVPEERPDAFSREVAVLGVPDPDAAREPVVVLSDPKDGTRLVPEDGEARTVAPVRIEAVELEKGRLYVAGDANEDARVRVYIDEAFIGEAEATGNRRFLLEADRPLGAGRHTVRADLIENGEVTARAEVPLIHEPLQPDGEGASTPEDAPADDPGAIRTGSSLIIKWGDSLWRISRRTYGRGTRYSTIYKANRDQIRDPDKIYPGQVFKLPGVDAAGAATR